MSRLTLSIEHWPIVVTTLEDGAADADYERYFQRFESLVLGRGQRFASLVDGSRATAPPSAAQRKMIADWEKAQLDRGVKFNVGVAMALSNPLVRGGLTALHWLFPPPTPTVVLPTFDEAYDWCVGRLAAHDIPTAHLARRVAAR